MKTELVFKRPLLEVSFFMEFYAMGKGAGTAGETAKQQEPIGFMATGRNRK